MRGNPPSPSPLPITAPLNPKTPALPSKALLKNFLVIKTLCTDPLAYQPTMAILKFDGNPGEYCPMEAFGQRADNKFWLADCIPVVCSGNFLLEGAW